MTGLRIDSYRWSGGREAMLRFGPVDGPQLVIAPRTVRGSEPHPRARGRDRAPARRARIGSALPDLPGQGDSELATEHARLDDWRAAFAAAAHHVGRRVHGLAVRAGASVDRDAPLASRWRLSPIPGRVALRDLQRATAAAGSRMDWFGPDSDPIALAGNRLSFALFTDLLEDEALSASPCARIVRLDSDAAAADRHLPGPPLWRRSEPETDPALAAMLADDIADWVARCDG